MRSPFAIFRKHAKILTVVLTGLAMFAFIIMGQLRPENFPAVMGMILGATLFWFLARRSEQALSFSIVGSVLGLILGIYLPGLAGPGPAVSTSAGSLSAQELQIQTRRRQIANRFIQEVYAATRDPKSFARPPQMFVYGGSPEEDTVLTYLLHREADSLGIAISDDAVSRFIDQITGGKLSRSAYRKLRTRMRISETELYNLLREQLRARLALILSTPRILPTPEQYWQLYRRLNVKETLDATAVPVDAFSDSVPEPSAAELAGYFEARKRFEDNQQGPGEFGFRQPRRFRIASLEARYEATEATLPAVTEQEIKDYYEAHKETLYNNRPLPDSPTAPGGSPAIPGGSSGSKSSAPAAGTPKSPPKKPSGATPAPSTKKPSTNKPAAEQPISPPVKKEKNKPTSQKKTTSQLLPLEFETQDVFAIAPDDKPVAAAKPSHYKPLPKYRPLSEVRGEIRDRLLRERTLAAMKKKIEAANRFMYELGYQRTVAQNDKTKTVTDADISDRLKKYAAKQGLVYMETPLISARDLGESDTYPIGKATEPIDNPTERAQAATVPQELLNSQPDQLYTVYRAEDPVSKNLFVYWKTKDVAAHVPSLDEPGVREQVLNAWKIEQARKPALERAKTLAKSVQNAGKPMAEVFAGQTVAGKKDGSQLVVIRTPAFSWLRTSSAPQPNNPFGLPRPSLSTIAGIDKAGEEFMRYVFASLKPGEVGVTPNADRSIYYIVKIVHRIPDDAAGEQALRQAFLAEDKSSFLSPYVYLLRETQMRANARWREALQAKYDVHWSQDYLNQLRQR